MPPSKQLKKKWEKQRKETGRRAKLYVRYANEDHRRLIDRASAQSGISINAWITSVTLQHARQQLGEV